MVSTIAAPKERLHANVHSYRGCIDGYAAIMAPMFQISPMSADTLLPDNFATAWQTELFVLGLGESNPFARRHETQEIQNAGHLIEVSRYLRGAEQGVAGDQAIHRIPGPIYIQDQAQAYHTVVSQFEVQQVFVAKTVLGLPADDLQPKRVITPSFRCGAMLHRCMTDIYDSVSKNNASIDERLARRFLALLKINMGVHPQRGDVRAQFRDALREQICGYIEQNLGNSKLSTATLLRMFGLSRATLYRMFEEFGGVRTYITERRAIRAVLDISRFPHRRGQARRASDRWGFSTQPNFNRTISRLFRATPGRLFASDLPTARPRIGKPHMFKRFVATTATAV